MNTIKIKPLSVNKAWCGRRFKTDDYKNYEKAVLLMLPKMEVPTGDLSVTIYWGFSNIQSDVDNPTKMFVDILQKKYGFNDNRIMQLNLTKVIVEKGCEFIRFEIEGMD